MKWHIKYVREGVGVECDECQKIFKTNYKLKKKLHSTLKGKLNR